MRTNTPQPRSSAPISRVMAAGLAMAVSGMLVCAGPAANAGEWSKSVSVGRSGSNCVTYRARLQQDWLVIEAKHAADWHTYAMDNRQRALQKLNGEDPLGMELPTEISIGEGLKPVGKWHQTKPADFSKPELGWYSWGFSKTSVFAVRVKQLDKPQTTISIRGQACDAKSCLGVDVSLALALSPSTTAGPKVDTSKLVKVQTAGAR